jgi:hypothetical protein
MAGKLQIYADRLGFGYVSFTIAGPRLLDGGHLFVVNLGSDLTEQRPRLSKVLSLIGERETYPRKSAFIRGSFPFALIRVHSCPFAVVFLFAFIFSPFNSHKDVSRAQGPFRGSART